MIDWVDQKCRDWGAHKRWLIHGKEGWPERSILGRLIEEGPGAGHETFGSQCPIKDPPEEYTLVSVALQRMALAQGMEKPIQVMHVHYVAYGKAKEKAPKVGVSVKQYWNLLHAAHAFISAIDVSRETVCTQNKVA